VAVASTMARIGAISAVEDVLGRCIVTSVAQPAALPAIPRGAELDAPNLMR